MLVQSHHRRQPQSRPIPKPILTHNPFPSYNPRRSNATSSTSIVTFAQPTSPINRPRLPLHSITESAEDASDGFLEQAANAENDGEEMIGDDEYDCGWAMDLGAGSPSINGSPAPGAQLDFGSSSFSSFSSSSSSSPSTPPHEESAIIASDQLGQSLSRRMTISDGPTVASPARANGAGAVYKRDTEEETGDRLLREWAVAVAGKGEVVTPPVVSSAVGRRSRGASVSQQLPPLSSTNNRSRSSSRSGRRGSVSTSNTNVPSASKTVWTDPADRDCGICFEYAVKPARTMCCGKIFCKEHLDDPFSYLLQTLVANDKEILSRFELKFEKGTKASRSAPRRACSTIKLTFVFPVDYHSDITASNKPELQQPPPLALASERAPTIRKALGSRTSSIVSSVDICTACEPV
ncbi:hypothetical protein MD484_g7810, partial [Candolleomyces efflorescens]